MRILPVFLVVVLFAGCTSLPPAPAPTTDPVVGSPPLLTFECPPGRTLQRVAGLCVGTYESRSEAVVEPYVVLHPSRAEVVVVGANVGPTMDSVGMVGSQLSADAVRFDVLVSEDAGATWRVSKLPPMGGAPRLGFAIDPALAFDASGALHASGMVRPASGAGWSIFYTRSADLGRTWSSPIMLASDADNDRSWVTSDGASVYVPWGNPGKPGEIAWSRDGGVAWEKASLGEGCEEPGPAAIHAGRALVPCAVFEGGDVRKVRIVELMANASDVREHAVPFGVALEWPILVPMPDGSLIAVAETNKAVYVSRSADGRTNWSTPLDVRSLTSLDDPWTILEYQWVAADPWGGLHVMLKGGTVCPATSAGLIDCKDAQTIHLAFDPLTRKILLETRLTPTGARTPPSLGYATNYEYDGLAFGHGQGFAIWTYDRGLDYARIVPQRAGI